MSDALDFLAERDNQSGSWTRAQPDRALIERTSTYAYLVTLPDGHVHRCAYAINDDGTYVGRCDCDGYRYHDGPCAHLCTLRKAEFGRDETTRGDRVRAAEAGEDYSAGVVNRDPPTARADGGGRYCRNCSTPEHEMADGQPVEVDGDLYCNWFCAEVAAGYLSRGVDDDALTDGGHVEHVERPADLRTEPRWTGR